VERTQLAGLLEDAFRGRPTREVALTAANPSGAVAVRVSAAGRFGPDRKLAQVVWTVREAGVNPAALEVHVHSGKLEAIAELGVELGREVSPLLVRLTEALVSVQRVLSSGGEEPPSEREVIRVKIADALSGLLRLSEVVTELERFAATTPLKLEPVDPSEVLDRAQKLLGRMLKTARVRVRNDMDEPAPRVLADAPRLAEIFVNLLRNARNAIARRFDGDPDASAGTKRLIVVEAFVKDPYVALVVTNNGLPVPAAEQDKIFLPSFHGRDPEKSGLGLPETAALLKQMGGAIRCESLGDKGTRFILTLPKALSGVHTPRIFLPSGLIISALQGGSQTSATSAETTPGTARMRARASAAMAGPIPQPGAVSVIFTVTCEPTPSAGEPLGRGATVRS
jgi:signal transduction histidine kinase